MRSLKIALLASVAAAAFTGAAAAADLIVAEEPVFVEEAAAFDWEGFYVGLFGMAHSDSLFGIGVNAGVNVLAADSFLLGVEGDVAWLSDNTWIGQVHGRAGFLATEQFLIYALAGIGADSVTGAYVPVGVGVEAAIAENVTIKGQYEFHWDTDLAADDAHVFKVGVNFHF